MASTTWNPSSRTLLAISAAAYWGGLAFLRFGPYELTGGVLPWLLPLGVLCLVMTLVRLRRAGLPLAGVLPLWLWYDPLLYWLVLWPCLEACWRRTGPWGTDLPFEVFLTLADAWPLVAPTAFCALVFLPNRRRHRRRAAPRPRFTLVPPTPDLPDATNRLRPLP